MRNKSKVLVFFIVVAISILCGCGILVERDKTTNVSDYNDYFGVDGKHKNDVFPSSIPVSAKVENFYYYYYNPFDPNYVAYLVYTCDDEDYLKETERLSKLNSSKDYFIYSATGFNYPVCAVFADKYYGYRYALADKENNRLIYVEINFCNYFSDIEYEKVIDKKHLPIGFDAKPGNATRKSFDNGEMK